MTAEARENGFALRNCCDVCLARIGRDRRRAEKGPQTRGLGRGYHTHENQQAIILDVPIERSQKKFLATGFHFDLIVLLAFCSCA